MRGARRSGVVGLRRRVSVGRGGTARRTPMYDVVAVRCGPRESLPRCDGSNRLVDRPGRRRHHHCCVHRRARPRNSTRARASRRQDCAKDCKNYSGAGKPNQSISVHRRLDAARQTHTVCQRRRKVAGRTDGGALRLGSAVGCFSPQHPNHASEVQGRDRGIAAQLSAACTDPKSETVVGIDRLVSRKDPGAHRLSGSWNLPSPCSPTASASARPTTESDSATAAPDRCEASPPENMANRPLL